MSNESDEAIIQPLLQKDKVNMDVGNQSAKYLLSKTKTDSTGDKGNERDKLLSENQMEKPSMTSAPIIKGSSLANGLHDKFQVKTTLSNKTNMNVDDNSGHQDIKGIVARKNQVLVDIDEYKKSTYNASPLIFTTAKIHSDGASKTMEPVQMNPLPILSTTIDSSGVKTGSVSEQGTKILDSSDKDHTKSMAKDHISPRISSINTSPFSGTFEKDISVKVTSADKKLDSNINQISSIKIGSDSTITDDKVRLKDPISMYTSTAANTTKVMVANKDLKSPSTSCNNASGSNTFSKDTKKVTVSAISVEKNMDINKNIQSEASVQKSEPSNVLKSPIIATAASNIANKDKISKSSSNKQIQRQKTMTEDIKKDEKLILSSESKTPSNSPELGLKDTASSKINDNSCSVIDAIKSTAATNSQSKTGKSNVSNAVSTAVKTPLSTPVSSIPIAKSIASITKLCDTTTTASKSTKESIAPLSIISPSTAICVNSDVKSISGPKTKLDSIKPLATSSLKQSNTVSKLDTVKPSVTSSTKTATSMPTASKPISGTTVDNVNNMVKFHPIASTKSIATTKPGTTAIKSTETVKASIVTTSTQPAMSATLATSSVRKTPISTSQSEKPTKSKTTLNAKAGSSISSIPVAKTTTSVTGFSTGTNISKPSTGTTVKSSSSAVKATQSAKSGTTTSDSKSMELKKSDPKLVENKDTNKGLKKV